MRFSLVERFISITEFALEPLVIWKSISPTPGLSSRVIDRSKLPAICTYQPQYIAEAANLFRPESDYFDRTTPKSYCVQLNV